LSVLTNFLELRNKFSLRAPSPKFSAIRDTLRLQLEWLELCRRNSSGWAWIPNARVQAHPWPTWSILDTFEEVLRAKQLDRDEQNLIKHRCDEVVGNLARQFLDAKKGPARRWEKSVLQPVRLGHDYNVEEALDLTRLMLAVSLHRGETDILPLAEKLFLWASQARFQHVSYNYHLTEKADYVVDSSLVPSVLRTLVIMASALKGRSSERLDRSLGSSHELVITKLYRQLQKASLKEGQFKGLWGVGEEGSLVYELYFSERSIEAITECLLCGYPKDISQPVCETTLTASESTIPPQVANVTVASKNDRFFPPNDIDKYTTWIPELAAGTIPATLQQFSALSAEDLLEFYIFRLFTNAFLLDGEEWGVRKRGKSFPDGLLFIPKDEHVVLYDAKACAAAYDLTKAEVRKFKDYIAETKRVLQGKHSEVRFFLVVTSEFKSRLETRRREIQEETGVPLVCARAKDLCWFYDQVRSTNSNSTSIQRIRWSKLFSRGTPLLTRSHFEEVLKSWKDQEGQLR
jgi:hypothetical protein